MPSNSSLFNCCAQKTGREREKERERDLLAFENLGTQIKPVFVFVKQVFV